MGLSDRSGIGKTPLLLPNEEVENLKKKLEEKDKGLRDMGTAVGLLEEMIAERDKEIEEKDLIIKEKENMIKEVNMAAHTKEVELQQALKKSQAKIENIRKTRDSLKVRVAEQADMVEKYKVREEMLEVENVKLQEKLDDIISLAKGE